MSLQKETNWSIEKKAMISHGKGEMERVGRLHIRRRSWAAACSPVVVGVPARSAQVAKLAAELESKREITTMQREQIEFVTSKLSGWVTS